MSITKLITIGLISLSLSLFAQNSDENSVRPDEFRGKIHQELKLTPEQEAKISQMRSENQKERISLKAEIEKKMIDKKEFLAKKDFASAKKVSGELSQLKAKMSLNRIENHEEFYNLLTAEQKELFKQLEAKRPFHHGKKGGEFRGKHKRMK